MTAAEQTFANMGQVLLHAGRKRNEEYDRQRAPLPLRCCAASARVPMAMEFANARDTESGLELTAVTWQEGGTGDTYLSVAILFGIGVGNQLGAAGAITDYAGLLIKTP